MIFAAVLSAAAAFAHGDFAAAAQAYRTQVQTDRADPAALFALAQLALYDNRLDDAKHWLALARAAAPSDPRGAQLDNVLTMRGDPAVDRLAPHEGPATLPFLATEPLPVVRVTVDGRDATFLIDTGAPNIVLDDGFAAQLGLLVTGDEQGTFAGGRHAPVKQTMVASLGLGSWVLSHVPASVLPIGGILGKDRPVDGILGTGLFSRFIATIDYRNARLVLRDRTDSPAFEAHAVAQGATIVPMWLVGDHYVFVRAAAGNGPPGLFNVDTGGTFGVQLTKAALDAAGVTLDADHTSLGVGGGGATAFVPFTTSVTLGDDTQPNVPGVYMPQGDQYGIFPFEVAGTVSRDFFTNAALTFDFQAMRLVIERG